MGGFWNSTPEAHWAAFCRSASDDLLMIGAREPGVWVEPDRTEWQTTIPFRKSDLIFRNNIRGAPTGILFDRRIAESIVSAT